MIVHRRHNSWHNINNHNPKTNISGSKTLQSLQRETVISINHVSNGNLEETLPVDDNDRRYQRDGNHLTRLADHAKSRNANLFSRYMSIRGRGTKSPECCCWCFNPGWPPRFRIHARLLPEHRQQLRFFGWPSHLQPSSELYNIIEDAAAKMYVHNAKWSARSTPNLGHESS